MDCTAPRTIRARTAHRCWWCGQTIEQGTEYVRWACFDAGQAVAIRVHPECAKAWQSLPWHIIEEGVAPSEFSRGCTCGAGHCHCRRPVLRTQGRGEFPASVESQPGPNPPAKQ